MILWLMFLCVVNFLSAFVNFGYYKRSLEASHLVLGAISSVCIGGLIVAIAVLLK